MGMNLRETYPRPVSYDFWSNGTTPNDDKMLRDNAYCVGGALCLSLGMEKRFPSVYALFDALGRVNRYIGKRRLISMSAAERTTILQHIAAIITLNEDGMFEEAWQILEALINYTGQTELGRPDWAKLNRKTDISYVKAAAVAAEEEMIIREAVTV